MKTYKVITSIGAYYVEYCGSAWVACQIAQDELGEDVTIYTAYEVPHEQEKL